jgi:hypothetical protein
MRVLRPIGGRSPFINARSEESASRYSLTKRPSSRRAEAPGFEDYGKRREPRRIRIPAFCASVLEGGINKPKMTSTVNHLRTLSSEKTSCIQLHTQPSSIHLGSAQQ